MARSGVRLSWDLRHVLAGRVLAVLGRDGIKIVVLRHQGTDLFFVERDLWIGWARIVIAG
jgi:hypothetical protein